MTHAEHQKMAEGVTPRCAIVTLSDTRTVDTDISGQTIRRLVLDSGFQVTHYTIQPDEPGQLRNLLDDWLVRGDIDAILINGGTGITARDQTIPVVESILETPLPGFGELFRMLSYDQIGPAAMLSRATAGITRGTVVFAMPGSPKAVELALTRLILPELKHLLDQARR